MAPPPREVDAHYTRRYYALSMLTTWFSIALLTCVLGVTVHINLNLVIGVVVVACGLAFMLVLGVEFLYDQIEQSRDLAKDMKVRRVFLWVRAGVAVVVFALLVWAIVLMAERSSK